MIKDIQAIILFLDIFSIYWKLKSIQGTEIITFLPLETNEVAFLIFQQQMEKKKQ